MRTSDFGGELGIRTLGWLITNTKFRVSHLRPLGQLSLFILNSSEKERIFLGTFFGNC